MRQRNRQTDRQRDRQTETDTETQDGRGSERERVVVMPVLITSFL